MVVWSRQLRIDEGKIGELTVIFWLRCAVRSLIHFQEEFLSFATWLERILLILSYGQTGHVSSIPATDETYLVLETCGTRQQAAVPAVA